MGAFHDDPVIVIGGGIAGLVVALRLAPMPVVLVTACPLGRGAATALAQGGIAAALGADDAPALHAADTLHAAAGLGDPAVAARYAEAAAGVVAWLADQGVQFDCNEEGAPALGLEAAHCRRRIVHAGGDRTGRGILDALTLAARSARHIRLVEGRVSELLRDANGAVAGTRYLENDGRSHLLPARATILATGGIGGLYAHTTNPVGAIGAGLALAARAGAVLRDLEFVQFHPTAMATGQDPAPLATEALRGEGAALINECGERFMRSIPGAELAPRDVVARAIAAEIAAGRQVFLDTRAVLGAAIHARFPGVSALCTAAGLDPVRHPIPVRPAAHYHMGGVKVTTEGRTTVPGLWACGEVASTGLHGANRLASNSLLEAVALAAWIAEDLQGLARSPLCPAAAPPATGATTPAPTRADAELRTLMQTNVGVVRDAAGLRTAILRFGGMAGDAALVATLVAVSAWRRRESRGAHQRLDHPAAAAATVHTEITLPLALRDHAFMDETGATMDAVA